MSGQVQSLLFIVWLIYQFFVCLVAKGACTLILGIEHYRLVKIHDRIGKLACLVVSRTPIEIGSCIIRINCYRYVKVLDGKLSIFTFGKVFSVRARGKSLASGCSCCRSA